MQTKRILAACGACLLLLAARNSRAEVYTIDSGPQWQSWQIPQGLVQVTDEGHLQMHKFHKEINAISNAHLFVHPTQKRDEVRGGIWRAGTNAAAAERIIDADAETFWQPDPVDDLVDWVVTIDLGRPVLAREIRLVFPDRENARPFGQFSVFVATGMRISAQDDAFKYVPVYRTTQPNERTHIRVTLQGTADTTRVVEERMAVEAMSGSRLVQYVRIRAHEKTPDASLAEIEVMAVGDNVSLGTLARGGTFDNGLLARSPENMFDGNMDTFGNIFTVEDKGGWKESGVWWQVDLGALFWLDELFIYWQDRGEGQASFVWDEFNAGEGYAVLFSEGERTTSGAIDFSPLLLEPRWSNAQESRIRHFRYIFRPRKIRYLFWHALSDVDWYSHPVEFMLFSPGYPARMELRSGFIDLGQIAGDGRAKVIKTLSWEAQLPPGTRLQLRSRSGNSLKEIHTFYDKKGDVVGEEQWSSLPKVVRGAVDTMIVAGGDWGAWSNLYKLSGETFQSESPRRYIQLEMVLSTEDPQVAPQVRSLQVEFEEALVQGARGRILPRQVEPNADTRFVYTAWLRADAEDSGFDILRLAVPGQVKGDGLSVQVGGEEVAPMSVSVRDSLLFVELPEKIKGDSPQVEFTARLLRNAAVFALDLGDGERPGLWQSVAADEYRSNVVLVPQLAGSRRLIGDLEVRPAIFTPNGDGLNDEVEIRFAVFKVEAGEPRVSIFDLAGNLVAKLRPTAEDSMALYMWGGENQSGELVPPGIYLCHIDLGAEAGKDVAMRQVAVIY